MPVVESNKDVKLKLITLQAGPDGVQKQRTTTLSNIVNNPENDALLQGAEAVGGLLQTEPSAIIKATEVTLTNQA